jgi:hypothetical protein
MIFEDHTSRPQYAVSRLPSTDMGTQNRNTGTRNTVQYEWLHAHRHNGN